MDGVVAVTHPYGCGVAINAPLAPIPIRTITNVIRHPNFGGEIMVVGLDCAHTVGAPVPMTAQVQEILQWLHNHEGGQKDHSAIAQYYEQLADVKIGR